MSSYLKDFDEKYFLKNSSKIIFMRNFLIDLSLTNEFLGKNFDKKYFLKKSLGNYFCKELFKKFFPYK